MVRVDNERKIYFIRALALKKKIVLRRLRLLGLAGRGALSIWTEISRGSSHKNTWTEWQLRKVVHEKPLNVDLWSCTPHSHCWGLYLPHGMQVAPEKAPRCPHLLGDVCSLGHPGTLVSTRARQAPILYITTFLILNKANKSTVSWLLNPPRGNEVFRIISFNKSRITCPA